MPKIERGNQFRHGECRRPHANAMQNHALHISRSIRILPPPSIRSGWIKHSGFSPRRSFMPLALKQSNLNVGQLIIIPSGFILCVLRKEGPVLELSNSCYRLMTPPLRSCCHFLHACYLYRISDLAVPDAPLRQGLSPLHR